MLKRYKYSIICLLLLGFSPVVRAQLLPGTCKGNIDRYSVSGLPGSTFEWSVTGGTIIADFSDSVDIRWDVTPGTYNLTVTEHTINGCTGSPVISSLLVGDPSVNLGPDQNTCLGASINLQAPSGYSEYLWSDGSTGSSVNANSSGDFWVEVTDLAGCKARDTVQLTFEEAFIVDIGQDTILCGESTLTLSLPYNNVNWTINADNKQTFETGPSIVVSAHNLEVIAEVTSDIGCFGADTMYVFECTQGKVPNAITPNGDGSNDTWRIENIDDFPKASIKIFDRAGRVVFEVQGGYDNSWNGEDKNGKPLPVDTYYYVIDLGNNKAAITGFVTIIR
ncbi:MAG: gliding motility-associated C-terminal domain-containing protein [Bacteroidales bacterium]